MKIRSEERIFMTASPPGEAMSAVSARGANEDKRSFIREISGTTESFRRSTAPPHFRFRGNEGVALAVQVFLKMCLSTLLSMAVDWNLLECSVGLMS